MQADYFGFRYTGYIQVPVDGIYTFYTTSDDGSRLYVGGARFQPPPHVAGRRERRTGPDGHLLVHRDRAGRERAAMTCTTTWCTTR